LSGAPAINRTDPENRTESTEIRPARGRVFSLSAGGEQPGQNLQLALGNHRSSSHLPLLVSVLARHQVPPTGFEPLDLSGLGQFHSFTDRFFRFELGHLINPFI
jgi:hypothetical protein